LNFEKKNCWVQQKEPKLTYKSKIFLGNKYWNKWEI
jgi:hypothetical protein